MGVNVREWRGVRTGRGRDYVGSWAGRLGVVGERGGRGGRGYRGGYYHIITGEVSEEKRGRGTASAGRGPDRFCEVIAL